MEIKQNSLHWSTILEYDLRVKKGQSSSENISLCNSGISEKRSNPYSGLIAELHF